MEGSFSRRPGKAVSDWDGAAPRAGRRRMAWRLVRSAIATAAMLGVGAADSSAASGASTNLLPNGEFQDLAGSGSLNGWKAQSATLSLRAEWIGGGHAGRVTDTTRSTAYELYAHPRPVTDVVRGARYSAGGRVRSGLARTHAWPRREQVCLRLREVAPDGRVVGTAQRCRRATSAWRALPRVTYTARQTGSSIGFQVRQTHARHGDSFEVDNLTLRQTWLPPPTLVALWHMDETSGTTMYDSVGSNNGTLTGSVTVGQPGFSGTAYGFHGSASKGYVSVPSVDALNPDTSDFSFSIHVETTAAPTRGDSDLMRKGAYSATAAQEYKMEIQPSGQASCAFRGTTGHAQIIAGPSVVDGNWHTLQCSKTSSAVTLTVDGQSFSDNVQIGSIANTAPVVIGAHPGFDYYNGLVDEAGVTKG